MKKKETIKRRTDNLIMSLGLEVGKKIKTLLK